jgi:hypothetical protein
MLLVRTPEGKRTLGRPEHRWVDNIKMNLGERVEWAVLVRFRIGTGGGL